MGHVQANGFLGNARLSLAEGHPRLCPKESVFLPTQAIA